MTKKSKIESALVWADEDHALAETNASSLRHFGSDAKVGSFAAVKEIAATWSDACDPLRIGFFGNAPCLVGAENSRDDVLCADDIRPSVGELRRGVWAVENAFTNIVEA